MLSSGHGITNALTTYSNHGDLQSSQHSSVDRRGAHEIPSLAENLLTTDGC